MKKSNIGLIGLGTMGAMLALNIAEKGFRISVFNRTTTTTRVFSDTAGPLADMIAPCETLEDLVSTIEKPRAIILMVPAGSAVDEQIAALRALLDDDDMIIDAGNANFHDTNRRATKAASAGTPFLGIGVSGGEEGARHGPSIMGGGSEASWDRVAHILEAISAKYDETPCATWMGESGAGHFVKTVHNGIEYADMQMIAEIYGVMRDGMKLNATQCSEIFARWNTGPLQSYLTEISAKVSAAKDPKTGQPMLDVILDRAGQKGTGRWTAIEAQHLAAPIPVIEAAVTARNLSAQLETRKKGESLFGSAPKILSEGSLSLDDLEAALIAGKVLCYTQGFALLSAANPVFGWSLPLPEIAKVWREGCIIRSSMLNDMASALSQAPDRNLMFAPFFSDILKSNHNALRRVVATGMSHGLPLPALASALSYFDMMRTGRSTANMIQAQRDFFGAHSFERFNEDGAHHGPWGSH
ncbi:MAG: NADP-dependent phosphogluconate dehydrogenase [Paracoccaceae bacterium]|nr:NADP-dependent phosphogluconate dehydrogenase [Paracoccaceae bacterium]